MGTLCWQCRKATGGCTWADELKPVEDWEAEATVIKGDGYTENSYHVKSCPEFEPDKRQIITLERVAEMIGVSERTVYRWNVNDITERAKQRGYNLKYNWADKIWYEIRG